MQYMHTFLLHNYKKIAPCLWKNCGIVMKTNNVPLIFNKARLIFNNLPLFVNKAALLPERGWFMCFKANIACCLIVENLVPCVVVRNVRLISLTPSQVYVIAVMNILNSVFGDSDVLCSVITENTAIILYTRYVVDVVILYGYSIGIGPYIYGTTVHKRILHYV